MDKYNRLFVSMVKCFLLNVEDVSLKSELDDKTLTEIYKIFEKYDLTQIVTFVLNKNNVKPNNENSLLFREGYLQSIKRYATISFELDNLCSILENNGIDYILLKGAVLRELYIEPFYRTSCDIDVLIKEKDLNKATDCLRKADFKFEDGTSYDRMFKSPSNVAIELHYKSIAKNRAGKAEKVLESVWEYSTLYCGKHGYQMCDGMLYFYHIAHMAKHFENGSIGFRPFMDLWLLLNSNKKDESLRDKLLVDGRLKAFNDCAVKLVKSWFNEGETDELTNKMQEYVFDGGAYGSYELKMSVNKSRKGGIKYFLSRIFVPYSVLKSYYPSIVKFRWLLPVYEIRRWGRLFNKKKRQNAVNELKVSGSISKNQGKELQDFCKKLGL